VSAEFQWRDREFRPHGIDTLLYMEGPTAARLR
jgi:hypothetical protein